MENIKNRTEELLLSTGRQGIADLLVEMDEMGFYTAPCSTQYHLACPGGLAEHNLNVYGLMDKLSVASRIQKWIRAVSSHVHCFTTLVRLDSLGNRTILSTCLKGRGKNAEPYQSPHKTVYRKSRPSVHRP